MEHLDTLGKRLRFARKRAGLAARELGRLAGISESYPSLIESGDRERIAADVAASLAKVLGVPMEWLVSGGDLPKEERPTEEPAA